jgi:START domain
MRIFQQATLLIVFISALMLTAQRVTAQSGSDWTLKSEKDGLKVYYRATSNVHELKLTMAVQASLSGIIQLLYEVPGYKRWIYKVSETRLLKRVSDTEVYYYVRLDFPWPMADRDAVMHTKLTQDPVTRAITTTSTAAPDYLPVTPDVVRMYDTHTKWKIVPGENGWLWVEYYLHSDPGGNIPDWAVNMGVDMGPRETMNRLRALLNEPKYRQAKLAHIRD